jgi:hypothetical protein
MTAELTLPWPDPLSKRPNDQRSVRTDRLHAYAGRARRGVTLAHACDPCDRDWTAVVRAAARAGGENSPYSVKAARSARREPGLRAALGRRPRPGSRMSASM